MNWYVKLFAPAIIAGVCLGAFLLMEIFNMRTFIPDWQTLGLLGTFIVSWGAIQTLYFPKRPHKSRKRSWLLIAIGLYATFFAFVFITNDAEEEWVISLSVGALIASIAYGLRYRPSPYSLAPGWSQLKFLGVLFCFIGGTLVCFIALDQMLFRILRPYRILNTFGGYISMATIASGIGGILCYYVEAILHHRRNSMKNWEKAINKMGDE